MLSLVSDVFLLLATMLVACNGQECKKLNQEKYNFADRWLSVFTGSIQEQSRALPTESDEWCENPINWRVRTIDGTCNHPQNLGATSKPSSRLLPPAYDDGVDSPRQRGVDGLPLTSARTVSLRVHPHVNAFAKHSILLMVWGQWVDHDLVATASPSGRFSCCGPNGGCPPFVQDTHCFPIELPVNDTNFPGVCLNFVRSLAAKDYNGVLIKPRQQTNTVTSFLDASQIYGSSPDVAAAVREPGGFLLLTKNGSFLPESEISGCIKRAGTTDYCFLAGDGRVNQHPYLGALHTLWLREHNRVARALRLSKRKASAEEIFQLARKIIIAMNQVITYNVWLPLILGRDAKRWRLTSTLYRSFYNPGIDPSITSGFSTAAFRFGHSTIPSLFPIGSRLELLRNIFNRPGEVIDNFDDVVAGMSGVTNTSERRIQSADRHFVEDVTKFLFLNTITGRGLDLVTINIQRGRDHGIPPYAQWRSFCGLRPLTGFNDTEALGPFVSELGQVYRSVNDIDLFTGMLHEPVDTGLVGPTVRCILRIQFFRTKFGDRFFFDSDEPHTGFTDVQLATIRTVTLSKVICQNSNLDSLPLDVFRFESSDNPLTPCSRLRSRDIIWSYF